RAIAVVRQSPIFAALERERAYGADELMTHDREMERASFVLPDELAHLLIGIACEEHHFQSFQAVCLTCKIRSCLDRAHGFFLCFFWFFVTCLTPFTSFTLVGFSFFLPGSNPFTTSKRPRFFSFDSSSSSFSTTSRSSSAV